MTGEATATFCPHCHEKDLQLQELKHKHDLEALEGKLKMPNFCAEHPDLCPNRAPLSEAKKTIETITKERDAALTKATEIETTHLHPELTEEFLTQQETCPNCGPHIKSYTKKKVDAALTEAKTKAEAEAKVKAEAETKARAEAEAKAKAEVPAKRGYER